MQRQATILLTIMASLSFSLAEASFGQSFFQPAPGTPLKAVTKPTKVLALNSVVSAADYQTAVTEKRQQFASNLSQQINQQIPASSDLPPPPLPPGKMNQKTPSTGTAAKAATDKPMPAPAPEAKTAPDEPEQSYSIGTTEESAAPTVAKEMPKKPSATTAAPAGASTGNGYYPSFNTGNSPAKQPADSSSTTNTPNSSGWNIKY